ncbi:unnamed protein product [Kuraishia capsulata CBS 1993]|uniref:Uncharacterized protein n=1 Tax=Kuraishia capsulata CBS 1993 TaxID=1382522 RepID=W6MI58_9ASCO|nr:uncharacterized protein KUCA_T00001781001 [Kuraishia capsulata CBS 1993]CDK25811.1 unnamed protein product [Kuraishia capsulata CBS 1993]
MFEQLKMQKRVVIAPLVKRKENGDSIHLSEEDSRLYLGVSAVYPDGDRTSPINASTLDDYLAQCPEYDSSQDDLTEGTEIPSISRISTLKLEMTTGEEGEVFQHLIHLDSLEMLEAPALETTPPALVKQFLVKLLYFGSYDNNSEYSLSSILTIADNGEPLAIQLNISQEKIKGIRQILFKANIPRTAGISVNLFEFFYLLNEQHLRNKKLTQMLLDDRVTLKQRISEISENLQNLQKDRDQIADNFQKKVPLLLNSKKEKILEQYKEINELLERLGEKPKYGIYDSRDGLRYDSITDMDELVERVRRRQQELSPKKRKNVSKSENPSPSKVKKESETTPTKSREPPKFQEPLTPTRSKIFTRDQTSQSPPSTTEGLLEASDDSLDTYYSTSDENEEIHQSIVDTQPDSITDTVETIADLGI